MSDSGLTTKDAKDTKKLAQGWEYYILKDVVRKISINNDVKIKQKDYLANGILPIIDQGNSLIGGYSNDEAKKINCKLPVIVFGDHTRIVKYITYDFCAGADGIKILSIPHAFNSRFFYYCIVFLTTKITNRGYARHYQYLEKESIPCPSLPEQQRIAARLDAFFAELDAGVAALKRAKVQMSVYRAVILNKEFNSEGIEWVKIADISNGIEYGTSSKSEKTGKVIVLRMGNIQNGKFIYDELVYTNNNEEIEKYSLHKNDVLFNRTNSPELVGKTAIYKGEKPAIFAGYLMRINQKENINADYLNYFMNSPFAKQQCNSAKTDGVNQSNINASKLSQFLFPLCSLQKQQKIVTNIETQFTACDATEKLIDDSLAKAIMLKQSILKKAFRGELV
ncbi:MAG: restriction endonuclease subunit S [Spirochaetaceae bacterium]|jgi:type I restriction enzyme S subunit|nr:restriction endonuclease subunit S [Spirochaetaceae bacterium]